jgi:serine/threonine protein kinase
MDLKPANILVSDQGRLLIGDFGMASAWPRATEEDFEREGDRSYMAPEVLHGVYGKAADIFRCVVCSFAASWSFNGGLTLGQLWDDGAGSNREHCGS